MRSFLSLPLLVAMLLGCQPDPARFPARLEAALASGDTAQVGRLLSRASRPLYAAMAATSLAPLRAFDAAAPKRSARVLGVQTGEGALTVTVESGGVQRDWVLVREDGDLKLDLLATSAHRSWSTP